MTDYLDDDTLGAAMRSEVPERPDGYWAAIDATLSRFADGDQDGVADIGAMVLHPIAADTTTVIIAITSAESARLGVLCSRGAVSFI